MVTYGYYGNSEEKLQSADRCKKKSGKNGICVSSKRRKGRLNKEFSV